MNRFTIPYFPPIEEYQKHLQQIWENQWITNNGPFVKELEQKVSDFLSTENKMSFVSNGTIAIQLAIESLELSGEIITTPFSYVATSSAIDWQKCQPIYVDIDAQTYAIDPTLIEEKITSKTSAILATHIFGNPCNIEAIEHIAQKHKLKVIYDASHCFGTKYKGESIFNFGDISTCSFHATKIFHTIEGGAVFSRDKKLLDRVNLLKNFGHDGPETFSSQGINGKNSEVHAAMGLTVLPKIDEILYRRKAQFLLYKSLLNHEAIQFQRIENSQEYNYAYCSIVISSEEKFLKIQEMIEREKIGLRRYFYPSLNQLPYYNQTECPVSDSIAARIFCLPMHYNLKEEEIQFIAQKIIGCL